MVLMDIDWSRGRQTTAFSGYVIFSQMSYLLPASLHSDITLTLADEPHFRIKSSTHMGKT
jgi:hypothetical protein